MPQALAPDAKRKQSEISGGVRRIRDFRVLAHY
jgi:hypothetical protein